MAFDFRLIQGLLIASLLASSAVGCRRDAPPPGVVSVVGNAQITLEQVEQYLQVHGGGRAAQLDPAAASALLDQLIEETAIAEADNDQSTDVLLPEADKRAAAVARIAATVPPPPDQAVEQYFQSHREEFAVPERRRVRQILVREEAQARSILEELRGGISFEEAARRYSRAPNAASGGEVGWVERGQLPRLFEETIFSLDAGERSGIVRTDRDFYFLFQVDQISTGGEPSLDQARPIIEDRLREDEIRRRIDREIDQMTEDGRIRVWGERLPFAYSGRWAEGE